MKKPMLVASIIMATLPLTALSQQTPSLEGEAMVEIKTVASGLKSTLKSALKEKGAPYAIERCKLQAPVISNKTSPEWAVSRTSLKVRNPKNAPAPWMQNILAGFEDRKAKGESIASINHSEVRNDQFYFIKAIPTKAVCTVCHGENISAGVKEKLAALYPNDQAVGFNVGDIRGAFIATKSLKKDAL